MIDTHTHLYVEQFQDDKEQVIAAAMAEGVAQFVLPAIDSAYHPAMWILKNRYPEQIHLMMGLHPTHVRPETMEAELQKVENELATGKYVAVGEIGIDLYWEQHFLKEQEEAFKRQIHWAKKYDLPFVIHARDSFTEIFTALDQLKNDYPEGFNGIFHCFTGTKQEAERAIDLGFLLGIGGVVTFKNGKIDQFLDEIPLEKIVLETDAPYLAPAPHRGRRNEPKYLSLIAEKLASVYSCGKDEIILQTSQNAKDLFVI